MRNVVLWKDTATENEMRSQVTELKLNGTRALFQQSHLTWALQSPCPILTMTFCWAVAITI